MAGHHVPPFLHSRGGGRSFLRRGYGTAYSSALLYFRCHSNRYTFVCFGGIPHCSHLAALAPCRQDLVCFGISRLSERPPYSERTGANCARPTLFKASQPGAVLRGFTHGRRFLRLRTRCGLKGFFTHSVPLPSTCVLSFCNVCMSCVL